uniref:Uncharacterized protein n=1 Tax=Plectus sambesii TaxID=2011161 RepID=A0A914X9E1_9BILA
MLSDQEEEASECTQPVLVERCGESNGSSMKSERSVYLNPVWVQCSHAACQKWRLLRDTFDATEVVDDWSCDMNSDEKHNKCEDIEESCGDESDDESFGFIYTPFSNGSIVWAAFDSYSAWWPAMIAPDPDENMTLQTVSPQCSTVETYHVVFFGKKPTRAWIRANKLKAFGKFDPKTEPVRDALVLRTLAQWNNNAMKEAREKAQEAFALKDIQTRLRLFGHMSYFKRLQQKCHQQLSQPSPSPVRKCKPLLKLAASQPVPTKRTKSRKKASKNAMDEDSLTIRERLINETVREVASGAGGVALGASVRIYEDSCAISASVTEVVEAVYNRVKNEVKMIKLRGASTDVTSTAKKFKAPVSATEKTPAAPKKARVKKFSTPTASTSNDSSTAVAAKKPRAKKPKLSSGSPADVSTNTVMTEETVNAGEASEDPSQTVQQESVRDPCASEAVAPVRTDSPSKPTSTRSLASELVSLSQQLRESSFDADMDVNMNIVMDVSQDSLVPPIAQSTPIMCAPLSTLDHSSQEGVGTFDLPRAFAGRISGCGAPFG